jgi:hypothetical protein
MYRTVLCADGILPAEGAEAAADIAKEFNEVRTPRYTNATCTFADGVLTLSCDHDGWDADGLNLMDELSDCISAFIKTTNDGDIWVASSTDMGSIK